MAANKVSLNEAGRAHASSLVSAGKVDQSSDWSLSTDERNALDPNMFMGTDDAFKNDEKGHWKYPFGKDGKVYRSALRAIASRASTAGEPEISNAASALINDIDKQHSRDPNQYAEEPATGLKNVEIFKVGKWRGSRTVQATPAMLDEMVNNFKTINQVSGFGVPVKLGHNNRVGEPAYGWVNDLARVDDTLVADFADMEPRIVDAIGKRRYNSVSIELYPQVEYQGKTFNNVLGGVALLGAEWPAVKGLKPLSVFAGEAERLTLMQENEVTKEEFDAKVAEMQKSIDEANARADKLRDENDQKAINAVIEAAEKAGKIVPANKEKVSKFAARVLAATEPKERAELLATFTELVSGMATKVEFDEKGAASKSDHSHSAKASDEVAEKARAAMKADTKLSFAAAVEKVLDADPALKTAYAQE